uniref:PQQ-dependent sugar dehydrogenase n=2 Tax=Gelidibacter sp. TaxID=2018083 RepID=UPI0040492E01
MMTRLSIIVFALLFSNTLFAQLPANYSSQTIHNDYGAFQAMGTLFNADGTKMFVWTYSGRVYVSNWNGTNYVKQAAPVLDISSEVLGWRDFGLLNVVLDPNFDTNGLIYLFYAVDRIGNDYSPVPAFGDRATICRLTRYQLNHQAVPMTTNVASRFVLIGETITTGIPLLHESHAGGSMVFGADGTLIVTTGDNASYNNTDVGSDSGTYYQQAINEGILRPEENRGAMRSQMVNSLCGKVLRLNPATGDGVPSNPFYDSNNPRSAPSRVWSMGFRNPFRMSINTNTGSTNPADANPGTLFVVDVGWNVWEDLHIIDKPGLNAGWPLYEGQTTLSSYYNSGATNPDEGNQLFRDLCVQPTSFVDNANPALRRFTHNRPEVAWRHGSDEARVPWFSGTTPTNPRVNASGSPTTGVEFRGNTGVSGVFIDNCGFGPNYEGKYFFTDYVRNFINVATLNDGSLNWISNIAQFAPANYGQGIVHMVQNPRDGSVFYTNIFDGSVRRLSFNNPANPTWSNEPVDSTVECSGTSVDDFNDWLNSFSGVDQCGNPATLTHNSTGLSDTCGNTGSETVTFTLTTMNGTFITKVATFTIVDTTNPTFNEALPSDITVECDAIPTAVTLTASDTCGSATVGFTENTTGSCDTLQIVRTWTATDDCGNETIHTQTISVEDTTNPTFNEALPSDTTVECDAIPTAVTLTASDTCGLATVDFSENTTGTCDTLEILRTWTATDDCGNETIHTQTISVEDTTNPVWVVAPSDMLVEC